MHFGEMMDLAPHGPDTFVGRGPRYPWGGLFGGQIIAQALRAAAATVEPTYRVHSLHAYFIRPGDHTQPIRFEVDRLRNGRSFVTRAVIARQEAAILHMSASFQLDDPSVPVHSAIGPDVSGPEGVAATSWTPMIDKRPIPGEPGKARAWMRVPDIDGAGAVLSACALAYLSDEVPSDAVTSLMGGDDPARGQSWHGISLDHSMWFQQAAPAATWQLHDFHAEALLAPRGLSLGRIYDLTGAHLVTVAQEVLVRRR